MKTTGIKAFMAIFFCLCAMGTSAQTLRSGYFLDGMLYRHQLNPAFMNDQSYASLFMLGNLNVATQGNVGVNDFLYKYNQNGYALTTFMNSMVGTDEFLGKLHNTNHLNLSVSMPIFAVGFKAFNGFNTVELGMRSYTYINLPYALFDFMKRGMDSKDGSQYHIKDLSMYSNNYMELAFGHAREVIPNRLSVGAKVKFLFGGANAEARINNMDIIMSQDKWQITADGDMTTSIKGGEYKFKEPDALGRKRVDGFKVNSPGMGGFGMGLDLGAVYKLDDVVPGLTVSGAVTDLGFIHWNSAKKAKMAQSYSFGGFKHEVVVDADDNDPGKLDNQTTEIGDSLKEFVRFYDGGESSGRTTGLATNVNVGVEYVLPYYKNLTFGLLSTTHINNPYTWTEARLSANVSPLKWFQASLNYAVGTFGSSLGCVINFHPKGFNFFIGTDHFISKFTPQGLPVGKANVDVNMGINITW